jgi:hypothetical protein
MLASIKLSEDKNVNPGFVPCFQSDRSESKKQINEWSAKWRPPT